MSEYDSYSLYIDLCVAIAERKLKQIRQQDSAKYRYAVRISDIQKKSIITYFFYCGSWFEALLMGISTQSVRPKSEFPDLTTITVNELHVTNKDMEKLGIMSYEKFINSLSVPCPAI